MATIFEVGDALDRDHLAQDDGFRQVCVVCGAMTNRTGAGPLQHLPTEAGILEAQRWLARKD